ncbi:unnamed protein product [Caenorhabditis sp. 36 PRJEB53466]|nr:unnamed protein product [Caenorhabditis sp. 36 PRJEB53466]
MWKSDQEMMDPHVFLVIVASHLMNLLFFVSDYLMYRLPATGLLTPWCVRTVPSSLLTAVIFFSFYSAYTVMLFPSLLSLLRFLLITTPNSLLTAVFLRFSLPFIFLYPIFFTFFLVPATGICKPLGSPYPFGAVMVYYFGSFRGIHNSPFYLGNIVVWMIIGAVINALLLLKLTGFKYTSESFGRSKGRKAEFSITVTTVSMLLSALLNCIFVVIYLKSPSIIDYLTLVKPIGSDCETVVSPWIFYLTHPMFSKSRQLKTEHASKSPIVVNAMF